MKNSKRNNDFFWFAVIVLLIVAIVLYIASFGEIDAISNQKIDSLSEKRRLATIRHSKLRSLIEKKSDLKNRLDRRFRVVYACLKILLFLSFFGFNAAVYFYWGKSLDTILNWNATVWGSYGVLNLIFFSSQFTLRNAMNYFRTAIENWVYSKYVNIDEQIKDHKNEMEELEVVMK